MEGFGFKPRQGTTADNALDKFRFSWL